MSGEIARRACVRALPLLTTLLLVLSALPAHAAAIEDAECMICHGDPSASITDENGRVISMYVDEEVFAASMHAQIGCVSCHNDINEVPHPADLEPVNCGNCHAEAEEYANSLHGQALARGDGDIHGCQDCHGKHDVRSHFDPLSPTHKLNLPNTCGKCHSDTALSDRHKISVRHPSESYLQSTHAKAIMAGNLEAAVCSDCHGAHTMTPAHLPDSPVYRLNITETCGKCHEEAARDFKESIHGKALLAGIPDAPTCVSCHGEHDIEGPDVKESAVAARTVSKNTCPQCHDDETIMTKYGIETMRQASYMDSYHGMASAAGSIAVASCTSCHGTHKILEHGDPASTTHIDNLPQTCGQCHPNAGPNFAAGPVHIIPTHPSQKALGIVRLTYLWLIGLTLGGMILHNTLLMMRHAFGKLFAEWKGRRTHSRFTRGQVIGHFVLSISFTALAVSGFALRYPEAWWSRWMFFGETGLEIRADVHRVAGIVFIGLMLVTVWYSIFTRHGRNELRATLLGFKDLKDIGINMGYALGLTKRRPKYDRYSYSEKMEYWGLWWGAVVMIITGLCMWFANAFLQYLPKYLLDIAALIHWYEAWLAIGTIVIWHIYYMVFDPETYPMNWSWITGRITEEDYKHHHPLEFQREVLGQEDASGKDTDAGEIPAK